MHDSNTLASQPPYAVSGLLKQLKHDLPARIVIFFVAVPPWQGIALASGAPLFAGLVDATESKVLECGVHEILRDFRAGVPARDIAVEIRGIPLEPTIR